MVKIKQSIKTEKAGVPQIEQVKDDGGKKKKFFPAWKKKSPKIEKENQQVALTKEDKIIGLLEEILDISRQNLWFNKRVIHWLFWQKIKGFFYLILIVVPLILAVFYLPPILEGVFEQYRGIWSNFNALKQGGSVIEVSPEQLKQLKTLEGGINLKVK